MIVKRKIKHNQIYRASINKNCPKFILGNCWYLNKKEIMELCDDEEARQYVEQTYEALEELIAKGHRDYLNLAHLTSFFGVTAQESLVRRNYENAKVFYRFLSLKSHELLMSNRKIEKPLSYFICLEKFISRLANPQLVYKLQFK